MLQLIMVIAWLGGVADAAPPDKQALVIPVGSGTIERLQLDANAGLLSGRDRSGRVGFILDVDAWISATITSCPVAAVTSALTSNGYEVYVGCEGGTIEVYSWSTRRLALERVNADNGEPLTFTLPDSGDIAGLWYDDVDDALLVITLPDVEPSVPLLNHVGALGGEVNQPPGFPLQLQFPGFKEAVIVRDPLSNSESLLVLHQQSTVTRYNLDSGQIFGTPTFGGFISVDDITPTLDGSVFGADRGNGIVARFDAGTGQFLPILTDLDQPEAVVASLVTGDEWLLVSQAVGLYVWELRDGLLVNANQPIVSQPEQTLNLQDAVLTGDYVLGGGIGGNCKVLTAAPFATDVSATPASAGPGDVVTVTFSADAPANWRLTLNGDRSGSGTQLASGRILAPGDSEVVQVDVADGFIEGRNRLYIVLTEDGASTHQRADVLVDTPPPAVTLRAADVKPLVRALGLSFAGVNVADLARYEVYVSTAPFEPGDFPEGGPEWTGGTELTTPIVINADPGGVINVDIRPLRNDVAYYIAVRTVDEGGLLSPLSNVVSGTPSDIFTASELAGEKGGGPCSTGSAPAVGWLALMASGLLLRQRRRGALAAVCLATLAVSGAAHAGPFSTTPEQRRERRSYRADQTPVYGHFAVRYGFVSLVDQTLNDVYDASGHNMILVNFGPQLYRMLELDFQVGWLRESSVRTKITEPPASDRTVLGMIPLAAGGTFRLHIVDEQILVPHATFGLDLTVWSERKNVAGERVSGIRGSKLGNHYAFGLSLLLDTFDRPRASLLEAQTGINDTWLTIEWRRQVIDARGSPFGPADTSGIVLSADIISAGLKLDF